MAEATVPASRTVDHRFFYAVGFSLLLLVFAGFARTYCLKGLYGAPRLTLLVHIHGLVMTQWYALFVVQVGLVAKRRAALHRKVGFVGVFPAGLVAILGTLVSLRDQTSCK